MEGGGMRFQGSGRRIPGLTEDSVSASMQGEGFRVWGVGRRMPGRKEKGLGFRVYYRVSGFR